VERTVDFAKQCGITNYIPPYPSIALGSADLSLFEMVQAYSMFPGRGFNVKPYYISRIEDKNGNVLASFRGDTKEVISESEAFVMTKMLQGVVDFGTGRALRGAYSISAQIAGKTGTTNDNADGWFIGFSPQSLTGVWVGCDDPFLRMLYTSGGSQMAMPAWAYYYQQVFNDPSLNIDPNTAFIPPASMQNEIIFDYNNMQGASELLPVEGEDGSKSTDYIDIPISDGKEKIVTESKEFKDPGTSEENPKPSTTEKQIDAPKQEPEGSNKKKERLLKRIFRKKD
ncbi:MAG: penicillin-binding transpeptidase domain-containing protein, partial [bacterium]